MNKFIFLSIYLYEWKRNNLLIHFIHKHSFYAYYAIISMKYISIYLSIYISIYLSIYLETGYEGSDEDYLTPSPSDSAVGDVESMLKVQNIFFKFFKSIRNEFLKFFLHSIRFILSSSFICFSCINPPVILIWNLQFKSIIFPDKSFKGISAIGLLNEEPLKIMEL